MNCRLYFSCLRLLSLPLVSIRSGYLGLPLRLTQWPEENHAQLVHDRLDHLESFYHVLLWVSLQLARHELNPLQLYDVLTRLFDHALIDGDKVYSNAYKDTHMTSTRLIERAKFQILHLRELLLLISFHFRVLYISPLTSITMLAEMARQAGKSYQTELEKYQEGLNRLNSKKTQIRWRLALKKH